MCLCHWRSTTDPYSYHHIVHIFARKQSATINSANTGDGVQIYLLLLLLRFGIFGRIEICVELPMRNTIDVFFIFFIFIKQPMESHLVAVTNEQNRNFSYSPRRVVANDRCLLDASLHTFISEFNASVRLRCKCIRHDCTARCAYGILVFVFRPRVLLMDHLRILEN